MAVFLFSVASHIRLAQHESCRELMSECGWRAVRDECLTIETDISQIKTNSYIFIYVLVIFYVSILRQIFDGFVVEWC